MAEARLQRQDQLLVLSGSYSFTNRVVEGRLRGRVTLMDWLSVIPRTARTELKGLWIEQCSAEFVISDGFECFTKRR